MVLKKGVEKEKGDLGIVILRKTLVIIVHNGSKISLK